MAEHETTVKVRRSYDRAGDETVRSTKSAANKTKDLRPVKSKNHDSLKRKAPTLRGAKSQKQAKSRSTSPTMNSETALRVGQNQDFVALAGFESSQDSETDAVDEDAPKHPYESPKSFKHLSKSSSTKAEGTKDSNSSVVYVGRIPHGFYEHQMEAYFAQFGNILSLRLCRSHKTGRSRGFAFIEFESPSVAEIVARTMDKYLLFGHILQVRVIPNEQVDKRRMFGRKESGRRRFKLIPRNKLEGSRLRNGADRETWAKRIDKERKMRERKLKTIQEMEYTFNMPNLKKLDIVPARAKNLDDPKPSATEPTSTRKTDDTIGVSIKESTIPVARDDTSKTTKDTVTRKSRRTGIGKANSSSVR